MDEQRKAARWRKRHIIYNNDGDDIIETDDRYGRDNLQIQLDFCREQEMEGFWSLRMNDTHDSWPGGSNFLV